MGFKSPVTPKRVAAYVLEQRVRAAWEGLAESAFIGDWFETLSERDQDAIETAAQKLARPFLDRLEGIAAPIIADPSLVEGDPWENPAPVHRAADEQWEYCEICEGEWCECEEDAQEY